MLSRERVPEHVGFTPTGGFRAAAVARGRARLEFPAEVGCLQRTKVVP